MHAITQNRFDFKFVTLGILSNIIPPITKKVKPYFSDTIRNTNSRNGSNYFTIKYN